MEYFVSIMITYAVFTKINGSILTFYNLIDALVIVLC